jgi:hypothetical protein
VLAERQGCQGGGGGGIPVIRVPQVSGMMVGTSTESCLSCAALSCPGPAPTLDDSLMVRHPSLFHISPVSGPPDEEVCELPVWAGAVGASLKLMMVGKCRLHASKVYSDFWLDVCSVPHTARQHVSSQEASVCPAATGVP